jgi:hypothetical protein
LTTNRVSPIPRTDQETVIVATAHEVSVYTTNPATWQALKRRAKALGGTVEITHLQRGNSHGKELGGSVTLPAASWSTARFGLRSRPPKAKP